MLTSYLLVTHLHPTDCTLRSHSNKYYIRERQGTQSVAVLKIVSDIEFSDGLFPV